MNKSINSDFLNVMNERGFIHQITDKNNLDQELSTNIMTGYIGFDCTAPSLHVGSLIQIMMLRWFQKTGHKICHESYLTIGMLLLRLKVLIG